MLTPRQNLLETIRGGHPDRFVKQYEFMAMPYSDPYSMTNPQPYFPGDDDKIDFWGVKWSWPANVPGMFPVHTPGNKVIPDIDEWEGDLRIAPLDYPDEMWEEARKDYAQFDRKEVFVGPIMFPGLFEMTHCLMGMDDALMGFYSEPEKMHEIIEAYCEWEMAYVRLLAENLHPDIVLHHDDWGSSTSTFMSPDMFREFYLEPYKKLYKCYKDNGFALIVHHSDSFAATLVPTMIEMGIDIWQGGTVKNDIPALVKQYGGKISFLTGIEAADVDHEGWTREEIRSAVRTACNACGNKYFIPCQTAGGPQSVYEGVYDAIDQEIDSLNRELFPQTFAAE